MAGAFAKSCAKTEPAQNFTTRDRWTLGSCPRSCRLSSGSAVPSAGGDSEAACGIAPRVTSGRVSRREPVRRAQRPKASSSRQTVVLLQGVAGVEEVQGCAGGAVFSRKSVRCVWQGVRPHRQGAGPSATPVRSRLRVACACIGCKYTNAGECERVLCEDTVPEDVVGNTVTSVAAGGLSAIATALTNVSRSVEQLTRQQVERQQRRQQQAPVPAEMHRGYTPQPPQPQYRAPDTVGRTASSLRAAQVGTATATAAAAAAAAAKLPAAKLCTARSAPPLPPVQTGNPFAPPIAAEPASPSAPPTALLYRQFPAGPSLRPTRLHHPRRLALRRERNRQSSRQPRLQQRRRLQPRRPPRLRKRRERRWPRCWERVCWPWVRDWRRRRRMAPRRQRTAILRIGSDSY